METALGEVPGCARELAKRLDPQTAARFVADKAMELAFPDRLDDEMFRVVIHRSTLDNIDRMWRIIAGRDRFDGEIPLGALAFAEMAGEIGVSVSQFERVYRVGIGLVWMCWYEEAVRHAEQTGTALTELLGAPSMIIHAYIDALLRPMLERFDATRADMRRTRDHLRRNVLRQALDGRAVLEDAEAAEALGIGPDGALLAFATRAEHGDLIGVIERTRQAAGAAIALSYRHATQTWIVWLWRDSTFSGEELSCVRRVLELEPTPVGVGDMSTGADGVGQTGREALEALRLAGLLGNDKGVLPFAEVRLESLLMTDPAKARQFVHAELGALDDRDERTGRLRATVLTWLSTGSNVGTAARLHLHEHTVRNHVAQAEELLGFDLAGRRTELLVALRLRRMLDA